jgi:uncharacterized protein (DUF1501 family)
MTWEDPAGTTRRGFLTRSLGWLGATAPLPVFMANAVRASVGRALSSRRRHGGRVLVIVQLAGGNDGLNTVVPCEDDFYYRRRPRLAVGYSDVLPLERGLGLHPAARGLKELFDDGKLAVVQGVGYPNHSRNHLTSTAVWHTGEPDRPLGESWAGRSTRSMEPGSRTLCRATSAWHGVDRHELERSLTLIGRAIAADSPTRVYCAALGGFDTHSGQAARHARALSEFAAPMKSFVDRLECEGLLDRVLILVFSEFGRRIAENAAGGTDHGEAGPVFLIGSQVRPGVHGDHPSLADPHRGALRYGCDFRRIYAAVLRDWLDTQSEDVLGPGSRPLELFVE